MTDTPKWTDSIVLIILAVSPLQSWISRVFQEWLWRLYLASNKRSSPIWTAWLLGIGGTDAILATGLLDCKINVLSHLRITWHERWSSLLCVVACYLPSIHLPCSWHDWLWLLFDSWGANNSSLDVGAYLSLDIGQVSLIGFLGFKSK